MRDFKYYIYNNNSGYAIGEIGSDNYVTGLGYVYWSESDTFAMGQLSHQAKEGWTLSNGNKNGENDAVYLLYREDGKMSDGVALISKKECLEFVQTTYDEYEGTNFIIWPDGTWRYRYYDESDKTRFVQYNAKEQELIMGYLDNGKWTWYKTILTSKQISDFRVPFHHFHQDINPEIDEFVVGDNYVEPNDYVDGPFINEDEDGMVCIGYLKNNKRNGMIYCESEKCVYVTQEKNSETEGGFFKLWKDDCSYNYNYYLKGMKWPISVEWFDDGTVEVRRRVYKSQNKYDYIQIDKDFNVMFGLAYDSDTKKMADGIDFNYEEEYKSKAKRKTSRKDEDVADEEESDDSKPKARTKKGSAAKKTTKVKKSDTEEEWFKTLKKILG